MGTGEGAHIRRYDRTRGMERQRHAAGRADPRHLESCGKRCGTRTGADRHRRGERVLRLLDAAGRLASSYASMGKRLIALAVAALPVYAGLSADLNDKVWIHGSADCSSNKDPAIEAFQFDAATYVLRQNKCVHFEAPFIYVLFGEHTVFVQDTGATADAAQFPLYDVVQELVAERQARPGAERLRLLVTHSHSHGDHTAGDAQFSG